LAPSARAADDRASRTRIVVIALFIRGILLERDVVPELTRSFTVSNRLPSAPAAAWLVKLRTPNGTEVVAVCAPAAARGFGFVLYGRRSGVPFGPGHRS
jgi:hypothetical protein